MNLMKLLNQHLVWRTGSTWSLCIILLQRRTATRHYCLPFSRIRGCVILCIIWCSRWVGPFISCNFKMIHHSRYSSNTLVNFSRSFRAGIGRWNVTSKQSLLPTSCALGYWVFVSGSGEQNCWLHILIIGKFYCLPSSKGFAWSPIFIEFISPTFPTTIFLLFYSCIWCS